MSKATVDREQRLAELLTAGERLHKDRRISRVQRAAGSVLAALAVSAAGALLLALTTGLGALAAYFIRAILDLL